MVKNLDKNEVLEFIKKFHSEYGVVPGTGFMAGMFKVTIQTINNRLEELHQDKKIERMMATHKYSKQKNYSSYKLI